MAELKPLWRTGRWGGDLKLADVLGGCSQRQLAVFSSVELPSVPDRSRGEPAEERVAVDVITMVDQLSPRVMTRILDHLV